MIEMNINVYKSHKQKVKKSLKTAAQSTTTGRTTGQPDDWTDGRADGRLEDDSGDDETRRDRRTEDPLRPSWPKRAEGQARRPAVGHSWVFP